MPINPDDSQFISFTVPNEVAEMIAARVAALKDAGHSVSRSELLRATMTRTNLDRAERDAIRRKNVQQIRKDKRSRRES